MTDQRANSSIHALVVMGVSGSGKSTIAKQLASRLHWAFEDADSFHPTRNIEKMRAGHALNDEDRWPWLRAMAGEIDRKRNDDERIVIACSALKRSYRDILVHGRDETRLVYLRGDRDLIATRLAARKNHFMPPGLLNSQFQNLEEPTADEHPIIVDINATVDQIVDNIMDMAVHFNGESPSKAHLRES